MEINETSTSDVHYQQIDLAERQRQHYRHQLQLDGASAYAELREAGFTSAKIARAIGLSSSTVRKLNSDGDEFGWRPLSLETYESLDAYTLSRLERSWNLAALRVAYDKTSQELDAARKRRDQASADAEADRLGRRAQLGILYLPGHPERRAGLLLRQFGDALTGSFVAGADGRPSVQVVESRLDADGDEPARLMLQRGPRGGGDSSDDDGGMEADSRWLVAVSPVDHDLVVDQDFREFLGWLLVRLPSFATDVLDRRLALARCLPGAWRIRWSRSMWNGMVGFVSFVLLVAIIVVLTLLLVSLYVPGLRAAGRRGARLFLPRFGLIFAYARGQTLLDDQVNRAARQLAWLRRHCRQVAIVAHGQGALVAHALARRTPTGSIARLITLGSPLRRFRLARALDRHGDEPPKTTTPDGTFLWFIGVAAILIGTLQITPGLLLALDESDWRLALSTALAGAVLLWPGSRVTAWGRRLMRAEVLRVRRRAERQQPIPRGMMSPPWLDLATMTDLVADGPYLAAVAPLGETCVEVTYRASAWSDHLSYLNPRTESLHRLLTELAHIAPAPGQLAAPVDGPSAMAARCRRARWLAAGRWVAALSGWLTVGSPPVQALIPVAVDGYPRSILIELPIWVGCTAVAATLLKGHWSHFWDQMEHQRELDRARGTPERDWLQHKDFAQYLVLLALIAAAPILTIIVTTEGWGMSLLQAAHSGMAFLQRAVNPAGDPILDFFLYPIGAMLILLGPVEFLAALLTYRAGHGPQQRWRRQPSDPVSVAGRLLRLLPAEGLVVRGARYHAAPITWDGSRRWVGTVPGRRHRCPSPVRMLLRDDAVILDLRDACLPEADRQAGDARTRVGDKPVRWAMDVRGRRVYFADDGWSAATRPRLARIRDWRAFRRDLPDLLDWAERAEQSVRQADAGGH